MNNRLKAWRDPGLLLGSLGIASIGDFIYLVAINLLVYQMTGSATAVAGLWIIGPLTNIVTKFWTGSFIDYRSKRSVIMVTYVLRATFILMIPFAPNMVAIYTVLVLLSVAKSFFGPASVTYVTMVVPIEKRKRFNALRSFTSSSAFIVGPAVGGALIFLTSIDTTLWLNSAFFLIAAILLLFLPENEHVDKKMIPALTSAQVMSDFTVVVQFVLKNKYVAFVYLGFIATMLFSFAMDAQEVVFTQQVIGMTEVEYSLLISITGIGSVIGAALLSLFSSRLSLRYMIVVGLMMMTTGYVIYAFSWSFLSIAVGFTILGFFNVFLNAGIMTFYQNNVPVKVMGRVTSIFQLIQSVFQVVFILAIGITADLMSLRLTIVTLALIMLISAFVFSFAVMNKRYIDFYKEEPEQMKAS
ncbi:MFS transporter [Alteribacter aurantiacus]|uniref:MFS transporter n=1 Tax=Alteribacter aurantiacus TaxID=254410 RepID=UPI000400C222|nr:MFS transporter [Alteribacter aurantiacus]